jgi:hypothetical protein
VEIESVRLWCLHPGYLDVKGLLALWREGLLARKVLQNRTVGYKHHPQLERFKSHVHPMKAIDYYLHYVYEEASRRGYRFDAGKIGAKQRCSKILVTEGQLEYELQHLITKLKTRDPAQYKKISAVLKPEAHPLFSVVAGGIQLWERRL